MRHMKWYIKAIMLISPLVVLSGCVEFESIEQPSSVLPDDVFTVFIEATIVEYAEGTAYFGIRLPNGWTILGDEIPYTGILDGTIAYDHSLTLKQESLSPSPEGYSWWVGKHKHYSDEAGSIYSEIQIQANHQAGRFSVDYMLGDMINELNADRSDHHLIEVVNEYSPRELQAVAQGDTVSLSWRAPLVSEGLTGYDVFRDGQIINSNTVVNTVYVDEDSAQALVCYTVSSLYDNGDVHVMPYEIKVLVFSGGTGDPNDPYRITSARQLTSFSGADFPFLPDKCFVLVNDIDLDPHLSAGQVLDRALIAPDISELEDGFQGTAFSGIFDGNGFRIRNLTMVGHDYLGLMGTIRDEGQVWNLGVVDANVVGTGSCIGILAGANSGHVTNCYSTGAVSGEGEVGGLVGENDGHVNNGYSTGMVSGKSYVGGLVGHNDDGSITASYSTGAVRGEGAIGGLVGRGNRDVDHSFWDVETSGQSQSEGGVGLTTAQMMDPEFIGLNGWSDDPNWILDSGHDYPHLTWEGMPGQSIPEPIIDWMNGMGTADNPYEIVRTDQLVKIGKASLLWDKHFILCADISLMGKTWPVPVIPEFWGTFDGNGFTISHLTITGRNKLGLFGQLREGAQVMDLGVVDANVVGTGSHVGIIAYHNNGNVINSYSTGMVSGVSYVGGLVGSNDGSITASYSTGMVSGDSYVGGLVGWSDGSITASCSTGSVSGDRSVGGLVGFNFNYHGGSITASYSTGSVHGDQWVGGLVGITGGEVINSYSTGKVSGNHVVGGLAGKSNSSGKVVSSFWDIQTSGPWKMCGYQAGAVGCDDSFGLTTAQMQTASTFVEAGWDFANEMENGIDDIWWIDEGQDYPRLWWETEKE